MEHHDGVPGPQIVIHLTAKALSSLRSTAMAIFRAAPEVGVSVAWGVEEDTRGEEVAVAVAARTLIGDTEG